MLINLQPLVKALHEVHVQLQLVARLEGHVGVAGQLLQARVLQQEMLDAAKVSHYCQLEMTFALSLVRWFENLQGYLMRYCISNTCCYSCSPRKMSCLCTLAMQSARNSTL